MALLKVDNVTKRYGNHTALDGISLEVPQGSIYGFLGPNGAGKTTLIRVINRMILADSGNVYFADREMTNDIVSTIGYMPEERGLYPKMLVGEQIVFFARLHGMDKQSATRAAKEWLERLAIGDWWNKKIEELSKGMAQKVQFIATVIHNPKLLIFDEPFSGFDPINAELLKDEIRRLRDNGATVILSTHNMSSVEELCDNITLINRSKNILSGSVKSIRESAGANNYRVVYKGEPDSFSSAIANVAMPLGPAEELSDGFMVQHIHISNQENLRNAIREINETCQIRSFTDVMPSMNDIFIRTVNNSIQ